MNDPTDAARAPATVLIRSAGTTVRGTDGAKESAGGNARGTGAPSASTHASDKELGRMRTTAGAARSDPAYTVPRTCVPGGVTAGSARHSE